MKRMRKSPRNLNEKTIENRRERIRKLEDQCKRSYIYYEFQNEKTENESKKINNEFFKRKTLIEGPQSPNWNDTLNN